MTALTGGTSIGRIRNPVAQWVPRGSGSVVEHLLAKEKVAGSNPVFRSRLARTKIRAFLCPVGDSRIRYPRNAHGRTWRKGRRRGLKNR